MDKNMIHIDDLVRQRLAGGEEQERPGAWLNMRDLLDQKMPVTVPKEGYNWRRMIGFAGGLVLLASLTLGGYEFLSSTRMNQTELEAPAGKHAGRGSSTAMQLPQLPVSTEEMVAPAGNETKSTAGVSSGGHHVVSDKQSNDHGHTGNRGTATAAASTSLAGSASEQGNMSQESGNRMRDNANIAAAGGSDIALDTPPVAVNQTAELSSKEQALSDNAADAKMTGTKTEGSFREAPVVASATASNSGTEEALNPMIAADLKASSVKPALAPVQPVAAATKPADLKESTDAMADNKAGASHDNLTKESLQMLNASARDNTKSKSQQPAPLQPVLHKDSFKQMTIVQRYIINPVTRTSSFVTDTISIESLAIERPVVEQLAKGKSYEEATAMLNPAASASLKAPRLADDEQAEMVSLSSLKVKSTRTHAWNARSFNEVMRDMKFNLSQVRFYPGVSAGGNSYMFGAHNLSGFQIGLFGLFTFGEHLSAMGEVKYVHRFNGSATLSDDYTDIKPSNIPGQSHLQARVAHFFKFSALQSIEMPLALRYAAGRVNIFAGANLAYNFAVNTEEVTTPVAEADYIATNNPNWTNSRPRIGYDAFNARFSVGGLAGISYELSPAVQIDLRATKNFWDNSFGIGASRVSEALYRAPSGQISLYYRFSQKNRIPRAK